MSAEELLFARLVQSLVCIAYVVGVCAGTPSFRRSMAISVLKSVYEANQAALQRL